MFITIEGIDGGGKTTQVRLLRDALEKVGKKTFATREPGNEELAGSSDVSKNIHVKPVSLHIGQMVRDVVCNVSDVDPLTELTLIYAARRENVLNSILPNLNIVDAVICDRFYDSSIAYYEYRNRNFANSKATVDWLQTNIANGLMPNITFLIDLDPLLCKERMLSRNQHGKYDSVSLEFMNRIREVFLLLAKQCEDRIVVIDGSDSEEGVHTQILEALRKRTSLFERSNNNNNIELESESTDSLIDNITRFSDVRSIADSAVGTVLQRVCA